MDSFGETVNLRVTCSNEQKKKGFEKYLHNRECLTVCLVFEASINRIRWKCDHARARFQSFATTSYAMHKNRMEKLKSIIREIDKRWQKRTHTHTWLEATNTIEEHSQWVATRNKPKNELKQTNRFKRLHAHRHLRCGVLCIVCARLFHSICIYGKLCVEITRKQFTSIEHIHRYSCGKWHSWIFFICPTFDPFIGVLQNEKIKKI